MSGDDDHDQLYGDRGSRNIKEGPGRIAGPMVPIDDLIQKIGAKSLTATKRQSMLKKRGARSLRSERVSLRGGLMELFVVWVLVGLQVKHYVADYTLQWPSMIAGKCHVNKMGGYLHAGIHVLLTLPILLLCGLSALTVILLMVFEFVIHYATDFAKGAYDCKHKLDVHTRHFWAIHGADQLIHQFTYAAIIAVIILSQPV